MRSIRKEDILNAINVWKEKEEMVETNEPELLTHIVAACQEVSFPKIWRICDDLWQNPNLQEHLVNKVNPMNDNPQMDDSDQSIETRQNDVINRAIEVSLKQTLLSSISIFNRIL